MTTTLKPRQRTFKRTFGPYETDQTVTTDVDDERGHLVGMIDHKVLWNCTRFDAFALGAVDADGASSKRFYSLDEAVMWVAEAASHSGRYRS